MFGDNAIIEKRQLMLKRILHYAISILPWIVLCFGVSYNVWYIVGPGSKLIDSDMSAELILANTLNHEHSILSTNWFYSTELHVFNIQWFFRIGLLLFPHNWSIARATAMILIMITLIALWICLGYISGYYKIAIWIAAFTMLPFGEHYQYYCTFGGFYWMHHIYILLGIVLITCTVDYRHLFSHKQRKAFAITSIIIGLITGLNGIRTLMNLYIPLLLATAILLSFKVRNTGINSWKFINQKARAESKAFLTVLASVVSSTIGYFFSVNVLSTKYPYESFVELNLVPYDFHFELKNFIYMFGFNPNIRVFSIEGIVSLFGLLIGGSVIICAINLIRKFNTLSPVEQLLVLVSVVAIAINDLVLCFGDNYQVYYWVPMFPYAFIIIWLQLSTTKFNLTGIVESILVIMACSMCISSVITIDNSISTPKHGDPAIYDLTKWLQTMGYTQGCTANSFWRSQIITEMSNGEIEVWTLNDNSSDGVLHWLQNSSHATQYPSGRHFLLLDGEYNITQEDEHVLRGNGTIVYGDDNYSIYEFEDSSWIPRPNEE